MRTFERHGQGLLDYPNAVAFDRRGRIYAASEHSLLVSVFTLDGQSIASFSGFGEGPGGIGLSSGPGSGQQRYVCDSNNDRIQIFPTEW